jgi:hypothetical protein
MAHVAKGTGETYMVTYLGMHNANQKYWPTSEFCTNNFIRKSSCSDIIHATPVASSLVTLNYTTEHRYILYQYSGAEL